MQACNDNHQEWFIRSHAGIARNECADEIAKYQVNLKDNNPTDTGITSTGPGSNPFNSIAWLALKEARLNLKNALKSHMHAKHRLGYADCKTGYYTYYQSLLPHANKGISNAFWDMPDVLTA
eukprot:1138846-Pelagomonas_calceolata.AAC.1